MFYIKHSLCGYNIGECKFTHGLGRLTVSLDQNAQSFSKPIKKLGREPNIFKKTSLNIYLKRFFKFSVYDLISPKAIC